MRAFLFASCLPMLPVLCPYFCAVRKSKAM